MSRTIDYSLASSKNGGKVTGFNYSRSLNELVGTWSATVAGGSFTAGASISFDGVMVNGIISKAYKDADKLWHIEGKDAGIRLMRTTPRSSLLPKGNARTVISDLASFCGVSLSMAGSGLDGFNVRSAVTGSTCAEAILELAMLSGYIAYIDNSGTLVVTSPASADPTFDVVLDDSGSDIDLDGYATQVTVVVTRRKERPFSTGTELETHYSGTTPSKRPTESTKSGSFSYTDAGGKQVSGNFSVTTLNPFGVLKESTRTINRDGLTVTEHESHDYTWKSKTIWRGNQEYVLFAYCDRGYTVTRTVSGSYADSNNSSVFAREVTTETMSRTLSIFDAPWVPADWKNQLGMVDRETCTRTTQRTGAQTPGTNMPAYSPPFDSQVTRKFTRNLLDNGVLCAETEVRYEARQVGTIAPVLHNGEPVPHFMLDSYLAIQSHSTPAWVSVETYRTYYEKYNNDGECEVSVKSEWSDNGARWMINNALSPTGDDTLDKYQEDYAKFSQEAQGISISLNGGGISSSQWQFLELPGRVKTITAKDDDTAIALNTEEWYNNGQYVQAAVCHHYDSASKNCGIYGINAVGDFDGRTCPYRGRGWRSCIRAKAALEQARSDYDTALLEAPVVSVKARGETSNIPAAGYTREFYIDDIITEEEAQAISDTAAANILKVKGTKGIRKTVTIPYNPSFVPNGLVVSVDHDWANLQTTVNYLTSGTIPDFMIPSSVAGIASFISDRDAGRRTRPMSGTVTQITDEGVVIVQVGGMTYNCDTKLANLGEGDAVLVSFTSGNSLRGQVIERL